MRGWIVAGLVVLAVSSVGMQPGDAAPDDMAHAFDAVSRGEQARLRQARGLADAALQATSQEVDLADVIDAIPPGALPAQP